MLVVTNEDIKYLKMAIDNSQKSFEEGRFPAGAKQVTTQNGLLLLPKIECGE